jgi:TRAP-type C4-dicarboxylate transport system substrate-binding protein
MSSTLPRRALLRAGAASLALAAAPRAWAQGLPKMRFSAAFNEQDLRADGYKAFGLSMKDVFEFQPYWANTLFKQGTELVALQRGNLDMANLAPQDISKQLPAWSLLTSAYLFRDVAHLKKTFKSDVGQDFIKLAREQLNVEVIAPVYFGSRHVNLKPDRVIKTPADLAGIKLRMPPGEFWQFLGESIGVNPTPVAFTEVYTALQTGAIDGQDNPLPTVVDSKFYEVTNQIALTAHLVDLNYLTISKVVFDSLTPEQQETLQAAAVAAADRARELQLQKEGELVGFLEQQGLEIYEPDLDAFREHVQAEYLASDYAERWPEGVLEQINALGGGGR